MGGVVQDSVRKSLVTATAASSCIACALMGLGANMPVALAPGMGLNAYFSAVVGYRGSGTVSHFGTSSCRDNITTCLWTWHTAWAQTCISQLLWDIGAQAW